MHEGRKFVFNLAPSGLLKGKINLIGPECVMDPVSFMEKEVQQLIDAGIPYRDTLFLGNVHIVTPYHKLLDFMQSAVNASTLKGMSPVHASKVTKRGIRLDHLFNDRDVCRRRLAKDLESYLAAMKLRDLTPEALAEQCEAMNEDGVIRMPEHVISFVRSTDQVQFLLDLYDTWVVHNPAFPDRRDVTFAIRDALRKGQKVLLEGPQSYWLSNASEKFWESSTSADTSAHGLVATARFNLQRYKTLVINVHKAPGSSRVGIGASPSSYVAQDYFSRQNITTLQALPRGACADFDAIQKAFHAAIQPNGIVKPTVFVDNGFEYGVGVAMAIGSAIHHGECGATTKKPRVVGFFDCVAHFEVDQAQGPYLTISALDRADDYDRVGLTIAYVYYHPEGKAGQSNGRIYRNLDVIKAGDPLPTEQTLSHCHPIVMLVDGWKDSPIAHGKRAFGAPLPQGCQDFIGAIEHFTGAEVISIGNGPSADNFIYLRAV
jgi:adenylosuccinate synthase